MESRISSPLLATLVAVLRFPLWWYTEGLLGTAKSLAGSASRYAQSLGIMVWIRNIFVPMYGQYNWQGRIISVFMRTVQIVLRSFMLLIWTFMLFVGFLLYVALPIASAVLLVTYFFGALATYG